MENSPVLANCGVRAGPARGARSRVRDPQDRARRVHVPH